jgi:hypothetical protein
MSARISRRRMITASSAAVAAPAVLAACGKAADAEDDRSEDDDPDLLNPILARHLAVLDAAEAASDGPLPDVTSELASQRKDSTTELESFISDRDGDAVSKPADSAQAESPTEALIMQLEDSIAVSLDSIGELSSPAYRQAVHRFITEDAAALAALRSEEGSEIAPDSFVFGAPATDEEGAG